MLSPEKTNLIKSKLNDFLKSDKKIFRLINSSNLKSTRFAEFFKNSLNYNPDNFYQVALSGREARIITEKSGKECNVLSNFIYSTDYRSSLKNECLITKIVKSSLPAKNNLFVLYINRHYDLLNENRVYNYSYQNIFSDFFTFIEITNSSVNNKLIIVDSSNESDSDSFESILNKFTDNSSLYEKNEITNADVINSSLYKQLFEQVNESGFVGIVESDEKSFFDSSVFDETIFQDIKTKNSLVITGTLADSNYFNDELRKNIFKNSYSNELPMIGDVLYIVEDNFKHNLFAGDSVLVESINSSPETFSFVINKKRLNLTFIDLTVKARKSDNSLCFLDVKLLVNSLNRSGLLLENEIAALKRISADKLNYFNDSQLSDLSNSSLKELVESDYYAPVIAQYGYSIPVYRIKGGEWKNVFLFEPDYKRLSLIEKRKLLTFAITSSSAFIYSLTPGIISNSISNKQKGSTGFSETTKSKPLVIYTDGSDIKGTGKLGYGFWAEYKGKEFKFSGIADAKAFSEKYSLDNDVSNPTMEMLALVKCLELFSSQAVHLVIKSDYQGVQKWVAGSWKITKPYIRDLVFEAKRIISGIEKAGGSVSLQWVKGHQQASDAKDFNDFKGNNKADELAKCRDEINTFTSNDQLSSENYFINASGKRKFWLMNTFIPLEELLLSKGLFVDFLTSVDKDLILRTISPNSLSQIFINSEQNPEFKFIKGKDVTNYFTMDYLTLLKNMIFPPKNGNSFIFESPEQQNIFQKLLPLLEANSVKVLEIKHFRYMEKYQIQKDGCKILCNFYYNKSGNLTKFTLNPENIELASLLSSVIQNK